MHGRFGSFQCVVETAAGSFSFCSAASSIGHTTTKWQQWQQQQMCTCVTPAQIVILWFIVMFSVKRSHIVVIFVRLRLSCARIIINDFSLFYQQPANLTCCNNANTLVRFKYGFIIVFWFSLFSPVISLSMRSFCIPKWFFPSYLWI